MAGVAQHRRQWRLDADDVTYAFSLTDDASGVVLDYWGPRVRGPVASWDMPHHPVNFRSVNDQRPLEFASAGQRHANAWELSLSSDDTPRGSQWVFDRDRTDDGEDGSVVVVEFTDVHHAARLSLFFEVCRSTGVVKRWSRLENTGSRTLNADRFQTAAWNPVVGSAVEVDFLAGDWSREFQRESVSLRRGTFSIGSRIGVTGHAFSPVVALRPAEERVPGERFAVTLEWSGNWSLSVDAEQPGPRVRVSCGVDADTTTLTLQPGDAFTTPASIGAWAGGGDEAIASTLRRHHRAYGRETRRPIVYNSWYATEFDVRVEHQLALADRAAALGAETFVVDDGWFRGRTDDKGGLGDWTPDDAKFPRGLAHFAEQLRQRGLDFGLWIEPEAVSPGSPVLQQHPEWVHRAVHRAPYMHRHQLVLNLGIPEVVEWVMSELRRLLTSAPIGYLKWDMNRPITDGMNPDASLDPQWSVAHTQGYYRVMQMLRDEFPHVTLEACAAGGGRIDGAVTRLADVVWPSDETGPRDRLAIQHGFLSAFPTQIMSSWVTDERGLTDTSDVSLEFRFLVAMTGVLGIGADLLAWDDDQLRRAADMVQIYNGIRDVVLLGDLVRHGDPRDGTYIVEYRGADGTLVFFVFDRIRDRRLGVDSDPARVRSAKAESGRTYRDRTSGVEIDGDGLSAIGWEVGFSLAPDADLIVLTPCG